MSLKVIKWIAVVGVGFGGFAISAMCDGAKLISQPPYFWVAGFYTGIAATYIATSKVTSVPEGNDNQ